MGRRGDEPTIEGQFFALMVIVAVLYILLRIFRFIP